MRINSLRPYHIEQWVAEYKIGQTSRRNYFRSIKTCLRWAVNQGYIEKNPVAQLEIPSAERRDVYLAPEEFEKVLTFVPDDAARELLRVAYLTGCRPQELLKVSAVHFERDNARWVFPQDQAKGKRKRIFKERRLLFQAEQKEVPVENQRFPELYSEAQ